MSDLTVLVGGGLACGVVAGAAAQFGRLCTFGAIEDAFFAKDFRRTRAYALALGLAITATQGLSAVGHLDLATSHYTGGPLYLIALPVGALLFGIGMSLVGTCGFGMLVRLGSGDLRALVSALVLGVIAFGATGGPLADGRHALEDLAALPFATGAATLDSAFRPALSPLGGALPFLIAGALLIWCFACPRTRRRWRLLLAGALLGLAVATGWVVTGLLTDPFGMARLESLTFVAPIGRVMLVFMGEQLTNAAFAVSTVIGVIAGSFVVTLSRAELRWEAFDDQREMRRHLLGAALMGGGGVMAGGCTIGQGLSAASALAISAPIAIVFMVLGARLGLFLLISKPALVPAFFKRRRTGLPTR